MRQPMSFTDPQVLYLSQLLEQIHDGILEVPRFQRPLVWQWDQRLELFRSIRDGIPMGAILVWRTGEASVTSFDTLGPHPLVARDRIGSHQYLLDGVQRLSTLYSALFPIAAASRDDEAYRVFYRLDTHDFVNSMDDDIDELCLPLDIVLDSIRLIRFQRELPQTADDQVIEECDSIAKAFRTYKVPIIPITTDDVDLATRTFQRINSQGQTMSEVHMLQALTWTSDFDFREEMEHSRVEIFGPLGWLEVDDETILKVSKAAFDLDVYEASVEDISLELKLHPDQIGESARAIGKAIQFLEGRCSVPSVNVLPYSLQLVVLADAFRLVPEPSADLLAMLEAWFWTSSYGELFRGLSGYRLQRVIRSMRQLITFGTFEWAGHRAYERQPLRPAFDFRSARSKALVLLMIRQQGRYQADGAGMSLVRDLGRHAVTQFAPWTPKREKWFSSPGNRFVVRVEDAQELRHVLQYGDSETVEELRYIHAISRGSLAAMQKGDWRTSVRLRYDTFERGERRRAARFADVLGI